MTMRSAILAAIVTVAVPARADDRLELGGFAGVDHLSNRLELGDTWALPVTSGSTPILGARAGYLVSPEMWGDTQWAFGGEAELSLAPTFTDSRTIPVSYFAPYLGYRGHVIARLRRGRLGLHVVAGLGGETLATRAPGDRTDTSLQYYWGIGVSLASGSRGQLRIDGRSVYMLSRSGDDTASYELLLGFAATFGRHAPPPRAAEPPPPIERPPVAAVDRDRDGDGIPDSRDKCPLEPETVNGVEDEDGCPEADPDHDGIVGSRDKCPNDPEDFDQFQDEDGCPDPDNDQDGILDAVDRCPNAAETFNGWQDEDGCPDELPDAIKLAIAAIGQVKFEPGKARVTSSAEHLLEAAIDMLEKLPKVELVITGHPEQADDKTAVLAKRRAEAVKWYLVDHGIAQARIATKLGDVAATGPTVEAALPVAAHPGK